MPNDAYAAPPIVVVAVLDPRKNTGALNPDTPDPTKNTPDLYHFPKVRL
jgi:hypothetical protein